MMTRYWQLLPTLVLAACATATPPAATAPPPAPPPPPGLSHLIGLDPVAVTRLLGPASLDRTEGPARQLQFIRPPCVLDVYLYPHSPGGTMQVRTATARKPDGSRIDPGACLALLLPPGSR